MAEEREQPRKGLCTGGPGREVAACHLLASQCLGRGQGPLGGAMGFWAMLRGCGLAEMPRPTEVPEKRDRA